MPPAPAFHAVPRQAWQASCATHLTASASPAEELPADEKYPVWQGACLRGDLAEESEQYWRVVDATLGGRQVPARFTFLHKPHWRFIWPNPDAALGPMPPPGSDQRIAYWLKNQPWQNFGDFLSELLFAALATGPVAGPYEVIHLIGSVISTSNIASALSHTSTGPGRPVAFWGCGMREGTFIAPDLLARCAFHGVRGPLTRDALNLPQNTPLGDPGLLLPLLHTPRPHALEGEILCIPHYFEPLSDAQLLEMTGADAVLRPRLRPDPEACRDFIDAIAGARLVLAGALHAVITAAAYGVPFAYLDTGFIDLPFKWADFAGAAGFAGRFVKTAEQGMAMYENTIQPVLRLPKLAPILEAAPLCAPDQLLAQARHYDSGG